MNHVITIKNHIFGKGSPVICVPVVEKKADEICHVIKKMVERKVEMIEWRMDWYEDVRNHDLLKQLLEKIAPYVKETVLLCTFRSKMQGGEAELTQEEYLALNRLVAASGVADLIDLEFYETENPIAVMKELQDKGVRVVCSNHNFLTTPSAEEMEKQLSEMVEAGADFAKLAVMPKQKTQVLEVMKSVLAVKEKYPQSHLIAMSMGVMGVITRLLGEWYESEVTFAAFEKASAPGQVSCTEVEKFLVQLEEVMGE